MSKIEQAHTEGRHEMAPSRRCKLCWALVREAEAKLRAVTRVDLMTLRLTVEEGARPSYLGALKRCVGAGLVLFSNNGVGGPMLTDAGRKALSGVNSDE